jgi:PhnB protein
MFNGSCAEALECYKAAFNAQVSEITRYGDIPPDPAFPVSEARRKLVLHAKLAIDGEEIMCADSYDHSTHGDNMYVSVTTPDSAYVQKAWDILKAGGEVYMDLAPAFFSASHGSLRDKFGVNWMFTVL